ncbi:hypothetical protein BDZ45DRAFT_488104 [Acephala macrosclerotiorum]|nr:hypothetical protein BDZ45DRAFT_488104 [Acephala macrosclerotiorum]
MNFAHKKCCKAAYFNPEIDILHLRVSEGNGFGPFVSQILKILTNMPDKNLVKYLSVPEEFWPLYFQSSWYRLHRPPILLFPSLKTVTVSFAIPRARRVGHSGTCRNAAAGKTCFIGLTDLYDDVHDPLLIEKRMKDMIINFQALLLSGTWGSTTWQCPQFEYAALCHRSVSKKAFYCTPLGIGKYGAMRQGTEEQIERMNGLLLWPLQQETASNVEIREGKGKDKA